MVGAQDLDLGPSKRRMVCAAAVCGDVRVVGAPGVRVGVGAVELGEELVRALEVAVDDVEVVDVGAAEEESESDVPVGLLACAEDGYVVDVAPFLEEHDACEGGAEGGDFLGV